MVNEAIEAFGDIGLSGAIITKMDEAASLGSVISNLVKHQLPLSFIGNGQRVPEDLLPARAEALVAEAVTLANKYSADDKSMNDSSMNSYSLEKVANDR